MSLPTDVRDPLVGLMGEEAAEAWWTHPESAWLSGLTPSQLWATGKPDDQRTVLDIIEAALVGAVPLEGH